LEWRTVTNRSFPFLLLATLSWLPPALAEPPISRTLTQGQVACEQAQLQRLARRMAFIGFADSNLLLWRSSPGGGEYGGLVTSPFPLRGGQIGFEPFSRVETQMAFDLHLRIEGDRLDPSRPLLPQGQLIRRDAASNVLYTRPLPPFYPFPLVLLFEMAPQLVDAFEPIAPLVLTTEPAKGRAERAGRGIEVDDLASACHGEVTEFDRQVYTILSRSLRFSTCLYPPSFFCFPITTQFKATLQRAQAPHHFWAVIHLYGYACTPDEEDCQYVSGPVFIVELTFTPDERGRITSGAARVLPECSEGETFACSPSGCPQGAVFILPPLTPGRDQQDQSAFDRGVFLRCDRSDPKNTVLSAEIDWADLLRDTAWNGEP
jgi:hypothetical protein